MRDQQPQSNELAALMGPAWSAAKVCSSLGVTVDRLASQQDSGEVLGLVADDGVTVYPVFQFWRRGDRVEVKPALVPIFQTLRGFDGWAVAVLVFTPSPELNGASPLEWVRRGHEHQALKVFASVVAREWSSGATQHG